MPKVVKGTILAVVIYTIFYILATTNQEASLTIPAETMYLLFIYSIVGSIGMVVVLPIIIFKNRK
ncbi:hypothetical protein [Salirhabdus salicampi]|uniref:hypothetical protein n=1 Tax=Salirhabdus salicampi TaxID=476102 RepID=UPI0020C41524|nr:hypothetical protein [Salirhabdus salicampi]MCP8617835.1 hypothetical protein [Salirhabdus salicampi]